MLYNKEHCKVSPTLKETVRHKSAVAEGTGVTGSPERWLFVYDIWAIFLCCASIGI